MDQPSLLTQILSSLGALLILVAYIGHQSRRTWMKPENAAYNVLNTLGAAILAYIAMRPLQVGFAVMETSWTIVSIVALFKVISRKKAAA